jgi:hypothetical protein
MLANNIWLLMANEYVTSIRFFYMNAGSTYHFFFLHFFQQTNVAESTQPTS